jgi:hypothetical protein
MTYSADWIIMSPDPARLDAFTAAAGARPLDGHAVDFAPWTDERAGVLRVIR